MIGDVLVVGDTVVVNIPDSNWAWGYHPVENQNGTKAVVTGFGEIDYSRIQNFGKEPGIYNNYCWISLEGIDGLVSCCFVELEDKDEYERRVKRYHAGEYKKEPIKPLPEMEFWEEDVVSVNWDSESPWVGQSEFKIRSINYHYLEQKRNDGGPMPEYNVEPAYVNGGHVAVNGSRVTLISRGNVWKHHNGEKPEFKDLSEEADFFRMLGHTDNVRNPENDLYKWELKEVIQASRDGIVDCLSVSGGIFGGNTRHETIRFRDRNLGERVRALFIEEFKDKLDSGVEADTQIPSAKG